MAKKVLLLVFFVPVLLFASDPSRITYMTEDYPPENYLEGGQLKGYAVDILKAVWEKMGVPEQSIKVLPWARAYDTLRTTPDTMLFAMMRTPEREGLFKWVGPIFEARIALFCLDTKKIQASEAKDLYRFRIGVIRNDVGMNILKDSGFPAESIRQVNSLKQLLQMLVSDRIDLVCTTGNSIREFMDHDRTLEFPCREVLFLAHMKVYYAFNKDTSQDLVNRFQAALDAIDSLRKEIIRRYHYSP